MRARWTSFVAVAIFVNAAFAYGPWLEWTPLGGVEIDDAGLPRAFARN